MRSKISILAVVGVSLALVLSFGGFNTAKAFPSYTGGETITLPAGSSNLIGDDEATNAVSVCCSDADINTGKFTPDTYGLHGTLHP